MALFDGKVFDIEIFSTYISCQHWANHVESSHREEGHADVKLQQHQSLN